MRAVIRNKLKQLLSARQGKNERKSDLVEIFFTISVCGVLSYVFGLVILIAYYDNLIDSTSKPCLPVTEPFGKCNRVLRSN